MLFKNSGWITYLLPYWDYIVFVMKLKNCNVNIYVMDINVCVGGYGNIFSWAQVEAEIMLGLLKEAKKLTRYELNECINSWNKNINSNWNLRSYINGSIVRIHD